MGWMGNMRMEPEKKTLRIVSKRDYIRIQSIRAAFAVASVCLFAMAMKAPQIAHAFFPQWNPGISFLVTALLVIPSILLRDTIRRRSRSLQKVVPLTRANTTRLPVDESLVRASKKPVQEQKTVLLRAATHGDEAPAGQLLRPVSESALEEDGLQNRREVRQ